MVKALVVPVFQNYDVLKTPLFKSLGWEYYCVTDRPQGNPFYNEIYLKDGRTGKEKAAEVITCPHHFVDADVICVVGGQIQINTDLNDYDLKDDDMLLMEHPTRNCVYEEAMACILIGKDIPQRIALQVTKYLGDGLPVNAGMVQTGVVFRNNNKRVKEFSEMWHNEIKKHSKRDQLSFNYVNWKFPIKYRTMPESIFKFEFKLNRHG